MSELVSEHEIVFRVLRAAFNLPEHAPILEIFRQAARDQGISLPDQCAQVDHEVDWKPKKFLPAYAQGAFLDACLREQRRAQQTAE